MTEPLLDIRNLSISMPADRGWRRIVKSVSLTVGNEIVALVGESGSGKSLTGKAIMGLLPDRARVEADTLSFAGENLMSLRESDWTNRRGMTIGLMPQDPKISLNPGKRIGVQVEETLLLHTPLSKAERRRKALEMLSRVGLHDTDRVYNSFPEQLSGGMAQRAMIAAMLVNRPRLLIADEPTSALDYDMQSQILQLMKNLSGEFGMGLLLISHDLAKVSRFADRVAVMRHGEIVEELAAGNLSEAKSSYTRSLWAARPSAATYGQKLPTFGDET